MRWFSSDTHFGHLNILAYTDRPFRDVQHMNEMLILNWNAVVMPEDEVWFLGDFAMGKIDQSLPLGLRLNGEKHLVAGNHDRCWTGNGAKAEKWIQRYRDAGFASIQTSATVDIAGQNVRLCHFPPEGDSHEKDRFTEHRPERSSLWTLHGHVHGKNRISGERQVDVGVDANLYAPVSEQTIETIIYGPKKVDSD